MRTRQLMLIAVATLTGGLIAAAQSALPQESIPRTPDGKPNFAGIWQASSTAAADLQDHAAAFNMLAGRSVVVGGEIPYQAWAAAKKAENFKNRQNADPLNKCFMPGVPRIMYMDFPFQIFQTPEAMAMTFEWSLDYRLIYTDGSSPFPDLNFWMGDSRGHWEGDTLVVNVTNHNDKTWFDTAGDFHSDALKVVERYHMSDADTIQYEATIEDSKVFTKPWTIRVPLKRRTDRTRLFEYVCQAEVEEANGAFTREERTWYPGGGTKPPAMSTATAARPQAAAAAAANVVRKPDGKPDFQGLWETNAGGANQGLEARRGGNGAATRGIVDPPDGKLPMQPWAVKEVASRNLTERGYDDPTAHCFPAGIPRSLYVPSAFQILQTSDAVVFLHERVSWRIVRILPAFDARAHLPENMRLWQGDSIGWWEGDTLVVDTTNFNGKTWLNEGGEVISYAEHIVERFTPAGPDTINYQATVTDPVVYTRPWTIAYPIRRQKGDLIESACHEEDQDLPHLKALKDAAAAKK
ncbi:MAG: hypothetical protein JO307_24235 [Bryobacterales bacterium]|nr:hypothetical protein [Bryobacterales bacterium]MBV9401020.1 hypothetical protein [Bryobacterales bacterium]